jgi:sugar transferase (PEP-CTERM/EpsH1 system associated)
VPDLVWTRVPPRAQRARALWSLARGESATVRYFDAPELRTKVAERCRAEPYDLVYVSSSSMAQYARVGRGTPVVMDFVDVDSDKWRQYGARLRGPRAWVYRLEAARLRAAEIEAARLAARCLVATEQEEVLVHQLAPWAPTTVVPNGVDLEYFTPAPGANGSRAIVFTGAMDYFPNVDAARFFAECVFPTVRRAVPDARFLIVGKKPAAAIRRLVGLAGVEVTGTVPDVRPYVREAAVAVAPLRVARGVQNKVLEAMAMGRSVVATPKAHEGLRARPGIDLLVEEEPALFADAVVQLLRSAELRESVGKAGRQFVEREHSWRRSMERLDGVIQAVQRRTPGSTAVAALPVRPSPWHEGSPGCGSA